MIQNPGNPIENWKSPISIIRSVLTASAAACTLLSATPAFALDQIVRPFYGIRAAGMGGTRISTGLYDEVFYGNPARATENPVARLDLLDLNLETSSDTLSNLSDLTQSGSEMLEALGDTAGRNSHVRVQSVFPAYHRPRSFGGQWAWSFGLIQNTQVDFALRRSYQLDPQVIVDLGPAFTVARRLLNESSSIGLTTHLAYRMSSNAGFSLADIVQGKSLSPTDTGGDGAHIDFDLGALHKVNWKPRGWEFQLAGSVNNLLGGKYKNLGMQQLSTGNLPIAQPRTYNAGLVAQRETAGPFEDVRLALEITDIGNNGGGSIYRLVHFGSEIRYGVLVPRFGINQGYLTGGLGLDLKYWTLEFATYGEEMSLMPGGLEDRRYAIRTQIRI